jgi:hypothetical protein
MHNPTTSSTGTTQRRPTRAAHAALIAAAAVVILAGILRFEGLGRDALWYDETNSLQYARWPITHPRHWNNGMALFHSMLHVWVRIAGASETALRFPSAVLGVAAVALLIALVRRINGWTAALAAGLMLALAWRHIYYSQEARSYSLFTTLTALTTLLLVRVLERPSTRWLVAYGVGLVALAYSHYQWVFVLACHNLVVLLSRKRVGWGWLALHAAIVLLYVPQIVLGVLPRLAWSPGFIPRHPGVPIALGVLQDYFALALDRPIAAAVPAGRDLNVLALGLLPLVAAAGIASCALPLLVRWAPRLRKLLPNLTRYVAPTSSRTGAPGLGWLPLVWFGVVFVLPFLIAQTGKPVFFGRYMAGAVLPCCWFIGLAVAALPRLWLRALMLAVCVALALPAVWTMKTTSEREDWRTCTEAIARDERPGDRIVLCHGRIQRPFVLYYRGSLPITTIESAPAMDKELTQALGWTERPPRIWLVVSHTPAPDAVIDYFARRPHYRLVSYRDRDFTDILLLLFERTGTTGPGD